MFRFHYFLFPIALFLFPSNVTANLMRSSQLLNFGWKFHSGDVGNGSSPSLDDSGWRDVDLPHDFQIEQPWVAPDANERANTSDEGANIRSRLSSRGFKEMGIGWYRYHLTPSDSLSGRRLLLDFEGIMLVGDVYLNGELIGSTDYGYLGFESDITSKVRFGQDNVIAVRCDTRNPENSRWYTGGGLYRDVHLVSTHPTLYFTRHPLYIRSDVIKIDGSRGDATLFLQAEVHSPYDSKVSSLTFEYTIYNPDGSLLTSKKISKKYYPKQKTNEYVIDTLDLHGIELWSCEHPSLYRAVVTIYDREGRASDIVSSEFGIRKLEYSPDYGLKLNGKKVLLKGIANHHTLGALGAAAYGRAIEKRIELLKSFGFNHIRTSHNPYSESLLDICDREGMLVVDELYDKWLDKYCGGRKPWSELWQENIPEFIKRDRNHPSVIIWSLGNELQTYWELPYSDWGVTAYRMQKALLDRYDQTRPVTVAMHPRGRHVETDSLPAPLVLETDIASYNYRYMYFPIDGRNYPNLIFYQSEANTSMMGPNYFEMDLDKVLGLAYWGMIDYLGESNGWPEKGWSQGVFDISLEPKPTAYFIKSYFTDSPMIHIGVLQISRLFDWNGIKVGGSKLSENWNIGEKGEKSNVTVMTYTNTDEVELFLNGKSLGIQNNDRSNAKHRNRQTWKDIEWEPGRLIAIGRNGGKEVARHQIESSGPATRLSVEPDKPTWHADGLDLQHVRIYALDKQGRRVYTSHSALHFDVEGDARLVAVSSGDHSSDELNVCNDRRLYEGSALVILRSGRKSGKVMLKVSSPDFPSTSIELTTE